MVFKNTEYMNGGVLKISTVCLYPKVKEEERAPPPGFYKRPVSANIEKYIAGLKQFPEILMNMQLIHWIQCLILCLHFLFDVLKVLTKHQTWPEYSFLYLHNEQKNVALLTVIAFRQMKMNLLQNQQAFLLYTVVWKHFAF
jgi:hypothetical protein